MRDHLGSLFGDQLDQRDLAAAQDQLDQKVGPRPILSKILWGSRLQYHPSICDINHMRPVLEWMDGRTDGRMDGRTDGRAGG